MNEKFIPESAIAVRYKVSDNKNNSIEGRFLVESSTNFSDLNKEQIIDIVFEKIKTNLTRVKFNTEINGKKDINNSESLVYNTIIFPEPKLECRLVYFSSKTIEIPFLKFDSLNQMEQAIILLWEEHYATIV